MQQGEVDRHIFVRQTSETPIQGLCITMYILHFGSDLKSSSIVCAIVICSRTAPKIDTQLGKWNKFSVATSSVILYVLLSS